MTDTLDSAALERLRAGFLARLPDFHRFAEADGEYASRERAYKDELRQVWAAQAGPALANAAEAPEAVTAAVFRVLSGKLPTLGQPQNLVSWRAWSRLRKVAPDDAATFGAAVTELIHQGQSGFNPSAAVITELLRKWNTGGAAGIARMLASCLLMLHDPVRHVIVRPDTFETPFRDLTGRKLPAPGEPDQYSAPLALAHALFEAMQGWGWAPRDLMDVQGLLWVNQQYAAPSESSVHWFVGASFGREVDQTERFYAEGVWEIDSPGERDQEQVRSMHPGELIAIKSTYVRKRGLPFEAGGRTHSVMAIKATGVITANPGDGHRIEVDWTPLPEPREWFFYTYQPTIWRVTPDKPERVALIRFAFDGEPQDFEFWSRAWKSPVEEPTPSAPDHELDPPGLVVPGLFAEPYSLEAILADGCFLSRGQLDDALDLLRRKKNLVLQGPPGTGKTWLAKRLGWALIGAKDRDRLTAMQFQPSLSYEDFVRGWRPSGEGGQGVLKLVDGVFLDAVRAAEALPPDQPVVLVIEEINRGNPAQIFGELLTLLEADKRNPDEALRLAYPRAPDERRHVPPNLFVIGTMNLADRSLALVDLALRRRFGFITLKPELGPAWRDWCLARGAPPDVLDAVAVRMEALNAAIAGDRKLGEQFRVGHSFVTPPAELDGAAPDLWRAWFASVVAAEIAPLLEEYWYDEPDAARREIGRLSSAL